MQKRLNMSMIVAIVLACLSLMALNACSGTASAKKAKTSQSLQVINNAIDCSTDSTKDDDGLSLTGGKKIDMPDEFDNIQMNHGIMGNYKTLGPVFGSSTLQKKAYTMWQDKGGTFKHGLPVINGRYGVVMKNAFGNAGDYVDIVYKDKKVLHAWLVDCKGMENSGDAWAKWGHTIDGLCNVMEFYIDGSTSSETFKKYATYPATESGMEYITGTVDYVVNYGSMFDNPNTTSGSSESDSTGSDASSITSTDDNGTKTTFSNSDSDAEQCKDDDDDSDSNSVSTDADNIHFLQFDSNSSWANKIWGAGNTIGRTGCGLCSLTCVIDILKGQNYTPDQVSDKLQQAYPNSADYCQSGQSGPNTAINGSKAFGLTATQCTDINKLKQALQDGKCIWLGAGGRVFVNSNGGVTHHSGHCVMFYKYADGKYYCHDSAETAKVTQYTEAQFQAIVNASNGHSGTFIISK